MTEIITFATGIVGVLLGYTFAAVHYLRELRFAYDALNALEAERDEGLDSAKLRAYARGFRDGLEAPDEIED